MAFEVIEHTADAGIRATAPSLPEAFAEAARGMYSLMVDLNAVKPLEQHDVEVRASDDEKLLLSWLLDLLFKTETEGLVFSKFVVALEPGRLRGAAWGEPLDEGRHQPAAVVKGVTRHMLGIERRVDGSFQVTVIFDL
jgi:tRNA nucleotidyltransferase (CCA-adding enzyme)